MFRKLLVPLDRSALAEQALGQAAAIARACSASIDVVMVHRPGMLPERVRRSHDSAQWNHEHHYLDRVVEELVSGTGIPVSHALLTGDPVDMLCARASDVGADLVVMTSHGRTGLSRDWFGSVADGVVRRSAIPVLMLRPIDGAAPRRAAHHLFHHILVPHDGSDYATEILTAAASLAGCSGARVTVLRVVEPVPIYGLEIGVPFPYPPPAQDEALTERLVAEARDGLARVVHPLEAQLAHPVESAVVVGTPVAQAVVEYARDHGVDLVAMTTHGRGTSRVVVGSVTDKVLRGSGLPILVHRPVVSGAGRAEGTRVETPVSVPLLGWTPA